ncbi:C40 family peptidase [Halomonas daqiaonensis]|uniref:NlpC/P60 family protein n=1 Tax=Halomonas daqiaonensis TaxID=650850 RepID=A0A1H7L4D5_9GAMM|nr:NlpC/P60 family protein [Halomonas daqiaonensis]SEK93851.1 NlpC/P60 family protein [Halomonas daqiaonensis]
MLVKRVCRITVMGATLTLLAGCATSSGIEEEVTDDYFARDLPGISADPLMSPVDNPILEARSLHNPPPTLIRRALLAQHERWVGTPYRLGGSSFRGVDCSALVQNVFSDTFRFELPRTTEEQVHAGQEVDPDALRPGDLVFFRPPGVYRHVGIYVGEGRFLHASTSRGVMISKLDNRYWQRHFWQARRTLEPTQLAQRLGDSGEG